MIGHNLADASVKLFGLHEAKIYQDIEGKHNEIDALITEMEDLEYFLGLLAKASEGFDEENDHVFRLEDQERLQRLSQNPELAHIFEPSKSSWMEGEIISLAQEVKDKLQELSMNDNLKRMITQRVEGHLQRNINMKTEEIMHQQLELGKCTELFSKGMQRMMAEIDRILSNIARAR